MDDPFTLFEESPWFMDWKKLWLIGEALWLRRVWHSLIENSVVGITMQISLSNFNLGGKAKETYKVKQKW